MKRKIICLTFFSLLIGINLIEAQQQKGQITINVGVGDSPEFNGGLGFPSGVSFPVGINNTAMDEGFECYSIIPNLGGTIDYGLTKRFSIGFASSYQSEEVTYLSPNTIFDKITRVNLTARILYHLNKNHTNFDHYFGIRFGYNYWGDIPPVFPGYPPSYFLNKPNQFIPSLQVFYGMRFYITNTIGIHFEVGIGEPYLAETGLTFRINTQKSKDDSK